MKKIIMMVVLCLVSLEAYQIRDSFYIKNDQKQINITCNNGSRSFVYYFTNPNNYYSNGQTFPSMDAAAKKACLSKKMTHGRYLVKKNSVGCTTIKGIKEATSSPLMHAIAEGGGVKSCFSLNKEIANITILKKYNNYYKIKDARKKIYFFEKSAIIKR